MPRSANAWAMLRPDGTSAVTPLRAAITVNASPSRSTSAANRSWCTRTLFQPNSAAAALRVSCRQAGPQT